MVNNFELAVVPEIHERVKELKESNGETWKAFVLALKEELFMENSKRVTKRTFLEWIAQPNKGLSTSEPLMEFECQFV